ncbi:hypothetical protein [Viridibacillus arvi]|uniref:hypothetical protein n=1 Tax=Viridibacillus arvi TaxID=263475 RepID=UPI003CFFE316
MDIKKSDQLNIYYLYVVTVLGKKKFTVSEISQLFKADAADWDKTKSTDINNAMHSHLSSMFKDNPERNVLMITRRKNIEDIWSYSINLDNKIVADNAKEFLTEFLGNFVDIDVVELADGQLDAEEIRLESDIDVKEIRIFELINWLDKETNYLQWNF